MSKRDSRHRGQIIQRGERKWLLRVFRGRLPDGTRQYTNKVVNGTVSQAQQALTKLLGDGDTKTLITPSKQPLVEFLDGWLAGKIDIEYGTLENYRSLVRHATSSFGHVKLHDVREHHFSTCYQGMLATGLRPGTVRHVHIVMKQALASAVRQRLLISNPADGVTLPKLQHREMKALSPAEVETFLEKTKHDQLYGALWATLLMTGLRPQEALALRWSNLTLADGAWRFTISRALKKTATGYKFGETKTKRGSRMVSVPSFLHRLLLAHRRVQAASMILAGAEYSREDALIFANEQGKYMDRQRIFRAWHRALKAAGLPAVRLYDARHTCASILLAGGENLKTVSDRLGHSSIAQTADTYSHVTPEVSKGTADKLDRMFGKDAK